MKVRASFNTESLVILFITLYYSLVFIVRDISGQSSTIAKCILFACLAMMIVSKFLSTGGRLIIDICGYEIYIIVFACFCYLSSIYSAFPNYAVSKGTDILEIAIIMYCVRLCLPREEAVDCLLKAWMWGGFVVVLYMLLRYGIDYWLFALDDGLRMDSNVINANSLGILAAYSILISIYYLLFVGSKIGIICAIPSFFVLIVSASRKAIVLLVVGIAGLYIIKRNAELLSNIKNIRNFTRILVRGILITVVLIVLIIQFSKLSIFAGINNRMQGMINGFLGIGVVDSSTAARMKLVKLGLQLFRENPIFGVGIDNAKTYSWQCGLPFYYLHNNYVEMLADGGVIGFCLYYSIYTSILIKLWKYRDFSSGEFCIVFLLFLLTLILDYGMVTYESKETYFFLLIFYLEACKMRRLKMESPKENASISFLN